jgi:hypothetical protein
MSLPPNTLWYNGDWDLFVGINEVVDPSCPCAPGLGSEADFTLTQESCVSRPPNELNEPSLLMGTYSDFLVTDPGGWLVNGAFSDNFTFIDQSDVESLQATYEIRTGVTANSTGTLIASGISAVTTVPTGRTVLVDTTLYVEYRFIVSGLNLVLPPDHYYLNVAPIVPNSILEAYNTQFVLFNSTTQGANAVGVPMGNNANDFFAIGNPNPDMFIPSTSFGSPYHDFSNGIIGVVLPICIDPNMSVFMQDKTKKRVADLVIGDLVQTQDPDKPARIALNYKNVVPNKVLVRFDKNSIEPGVPDEVFFVTTNHKILVNNNMVKPRDLINGINIKRSRRPAPVYTHTLVTDKGEAIIINNVPVATWGVEDWFARKQLRLPQN